MCCDYCGQVLRSDDSRCPNCGAPVVKHDTVSGPMPGAPGVGTPVIARWTNGMWYPGTIDAEEGRLRHVTFHDKDDAWIAREDLTVKSDLADTKQGTLNVGVRVEALWGRHPYPGKIDARFGSVWHVAFDDGDRGWIDPSRIFPAKTGSAAATPNVPLAVAFDPTKETWEDDSATPVAPHPAHISTGHKPMAVREPRSTSPLKTAGGVFLLTLAATLVAAFFAGLMATSVVPVSQRLTSPILCHGHEESVVTTTVSNAPGGGAQMTSAMYCIDAHNRAILVSWVLVSFILLLELWATFLSLALLFWLSRKLKRSWVSSMLLMGLALSGCQWGTISEGELRARYRDQSEPATVTDVTEEDPLAGAEDAAQDRICEDLIDCYARLNAYGQISGRLLVDLAADGSITNASYDNGHAPAPVQQCLVQTARSRPVLGWSGGPARVTCEYAGSYTAGAQQMWLNSTLERTTWRP